MFSDVSKVLAEQSEQIYADNISQPIFLASTVDLNYENGCSLQQQHLRHLSHDKTPVVPETVQS